MSKPLNSFSSIWKLHNLSDCALPAISAYSCLSSPKHMMYCRHFKALKLLWYCKVPTFFIWVFYFTSLLFTAVCKASPDSQFASLHFFFLGMVLILASCTMSSTSVHSSSGSLSDLIPESNLSLSLNSRKGFDLGHTWIKWSSLNLVGRVHEIFWRMWLYEVLRRESEIWGHRKEFSDYVGQQSHFTQGR